MTSLRPGAIGCLRPQPAALVRLVCFPHSGGGPQTFRRWPGALAPDVEVWHALPPHRLRHPAEVSREPPSDGWRPVVEKLATAAAGTVPAPVALFGHSLGALIAYEVARTLVREGRPPVHLFVSARAAPDAPPSFAVPDSDAELLREVDRVYRGVPDAVRDVPELIDQLLPALRTDLEFAAAYRYRPGPPLPCPLTVLAGDDDTTCPVDQLRPWARHTAAGLVVRLLPGGHFYLDQHEDAVLDLIRTTANTP